jgi:ferredoxin
MSKINLFFEYENGEKIEVQANVGESVLSVAHGNGISLEGACEGSLACSTCHVYVDPAFFYELGLDEKSEDEEDMLDLAFAPSETSRLGCQIILSAEMNGITFKVPSQTRNI